jgi:hypothetical protein
LEKRRSYNIVTEMMLKCEVAGNSKRRKKYKRKIRNDVDKSKGNSIWKMDNSLIRNLEVQVECDRSYDEDVNYGNLLDVVKSRKLESIMNKVLSYEGNGKNAVVFESSKNSSVGPRLYCSIRLSFIKF